INNPLSAVPGANAHRRGPRRKPMTAAPLQRTAPRALAIQDGIWPWMSWILAYQSFFLRVVNVPGRRAGGADSLGFPPAFAARRAFFPGRTFFPAAGFEVRGFSSRFLSLKR